MGGGCLLASPDDAIALPPAGAGWTLPRAVSAPWLPAEGLRQRTLIALIYFRLTVTAEPVDPATADQAAQIAVAAARAGVFQGVSRVASPRPRRASGCRS
jgi:hypothetical protein